MYNVGMSEKIIPASLRQETPNSSCIASVTKQSDRVLDVEFNSGITYRYVLAPEVVEAMMVEAFNDRHNNIAPGVGSYSIGQLYNREVRNNPFEIVG